MLMYLPEDKNDTSPLGKETLHGSRKLELMIEKWCIPCLCSLFMTTEPHIALIKSVETLQ